MSSQSRDEKKAAGLVEDYQTRRNVRQNDVLEILRKDRDDYKGLKDAGIAGEVPSLKDWLRKLTLEDSQ